MVRHTFLLLAIISFAITLRAQVPDPSFGDQGVMSFVHPESDTYFTDLVQEASGRLIVVGYLDSIQTAHTGLVIAVNLDGTLDPNFAGDGVYTKFTPGSHNEYKRVALVPDGSGDIYASGNLKYPFGDYESMGVSKFLPNGNLATFNWEGSRVFNMSNCDGVIGYGAYVRPNGKILLYGSGNEGFAFNAVTTASIISTGQNDISFTDGTAQTMVQLDGGSGERAVDATVDQSGRFLLAVNNEGTSWAIRLRADGYRDYTFDNNNSAYYGYSGGAKRIGFWPDGKILLIGNSFQTPVMNGQVSRLIINGIPDESFGEYGRRFYAWEENRNIYFTDYAWDPAGRLVIAGYQSPQFGSDGEGIIVRLLPNGDPDPAFGTDGKYVVPHPAGYSNNSVAIGGNGRLFFIGSSDVSDTAYVSCYTTDLTTDLSPVQERPVLRLWPNPASSKLHVEGYHGTLPPRITNTLGQEVPLHAQRVGTGWELDVEGLAPGTYAITGKGGTLLFLKE
ncbi:MAG TPA: hypothetical protein PLB89_07125 [Flavobacteriales bacterium]|nr:hypothetical protein [Flavobacteriales bacterium]